MRAFAVCASQSAARRGRRRRPLLETVAGVQGRAARPAGGRHAGGLLLTRAHRKKRKCTHVHLTGTLHVARRAGPFFSRSPSANAKNSLTRPPAYQHPRLSPARNRAHSTSPHYPFFTAGKKTMSETDTTNTAAAAAPAETAAAPVKGDGQQDADGDAMSDIDAKDNESKGSDGDEDDDEEESDEGAAAANGKRSRKGT